MTLLFRLAFLNLHCQNNNKWFKLYCFGSIYRKSSPYVNFRKFQIYFAYKLFDLHNLFITVIIFSLSVFCVNSSTKNDCRTFQPKTFQPQCSTLDFLTPRFNTGLFNPKAIKNFSTPNLKPQIFQPQSHKELFNPKLINPGLFNPKAIRNFSTPNL